MISTLDTMLIDPTLLFTSPEAWHDPDRRDTFIERFLETFRCLEEYRLGTLLISDELEALLYEDSQASPWIKDRDWKNQILPILFRKLQLLKKSVVVTDQEATVTPPLPCPARSVVQSAFMRLVYSVLSRPERVGLALCGDNAPSDVGYTWRKGLGSPLTPLRWEIAPERLMRLVNPLKLWPSATSGESGLRHLVDAEIRLTFEVRNAVQSYAFEPTFIEDIVRHRQHHAEIVWALARRLSLSQQEATNSKGLGDEELRGKDGQRRMRCSREHRIHYRYNSGKLLFQRFFGDGEHDDGL